MFFINSLQKIRNDFSISAMMAGFIIVLVGMTSSAILVVQAAQGYGVDTSQASSWLGSLCLAMGLLTVYFTAKYKVPVMIAWSTPGAVLLIASAGQFSLNEAIGAFIFSSVLTMLFGITRSIEKLKDYVPSSLISALLAGILLNFVLGAFNAFNAEPLLVAIMIAIFLLGKKKFPNFVMLYVAVAGIAYLAFVQQLNFANVEVIATQFIAVKPVFSISAMMSLGFPMFLITMVSQNLTGSLILHSYGYLPPVSKVIAKTGLTNIISSFFGGFTLNLSVLTAAIAMSPDSNPNKDKRYIAALTSGAIYILIGLTAGTVTVFFEAFPEELIAVLTGCALLGPLGSGLQNAFTDSKHREAAIVTFVIAASNLKFLSIGPAFWALLIGLVMTYSIRGHD